MSAASEANKTGPQTKKFQKGERRVPHHSQKAKKWYPVDDEKQPKKVSDHSLTSVVCGAYRSGFGFYLNFFARGHDQR